MTSRLGLNRNWTLPVLLVVLAVASSLGIALGFRYADPRLRDSDSADSVLVAEPDSTLSISTHSIVLRDGRTIPLPEDIEIDYVQASPRHFLCGGSTSRHPLFSCEPGLEVFRQYIALSCPSEFWAPSFARYCWPDRLVNPYPQYLIVRGQWSVMIDGDGFIMDSDYEDNNPAAFPFVSERPFSSERSLALAVYMLPKMVTIVLAASILLILMGILWAPFGGLLCVNRPDERIERRSFLADWGFEVSPLSCPVVLLCS